jgi:hypothetical protein
MKMGRLASAAALLAVAAALALLLVRALSAISLSEPLLVVTSGAEEEGVLGVLRAMTGATYGDPSRIPFNASYYNWLFFGVFATGIGALQAAFGLDLAWVPTLGRVLALAGAAANAGLAALLFLRLTLGASPAIRGQAGALAVWLGIGPLVGWWALSINPDLWATALTQAAVLAVLMVPPRRRLWGFALAGLCAASAWGFKQSYLFAPLAIGLFALIRRDWAGLVVLGMVSGLGIALPIVLGSPEYRAMLLAFQGSDFAPWQIERNLLNTLPKILPVLVGAGLAVPLLGRWRSLDRDPAVLLALCGVLACLPILPASAKVGAAENYYFPPVFFLAMLTVLGLVRRPPGRGAALALALAWGAEAAACLLVVFGLGGIPSVRDKDALYQAQRRCIADLPGPMMSYDPYLQLPWMRDQGPRFVLAYQYQMERAHGRVFERGGVGGLIAEGWFGSIALPHAMPPRMDGTPLAPRYRPAGQCAGLDLYLRD